MVRVQVRVEGPNDGPERVADPVAQLEVLTISGPAPEAARPAPPSHGVAKSGRARRLLVNSRMPIDVQRSR